MDTTSLKARLRDLDLIPRTPSRPAARRTKRPDRSARSITPLAEQNHLALRAATTEGVQFLIERGLDAMFDDFGTTLIPGIIELPQMQADIARMDWRVLHFRDGPYGFLTSDFPITILPGLADPNSLISLPLSPTAIFLASYNSNLLNSFQATPPPGLIDAASRVTIGSAQR